MNVYEKLANVQSALKAPKGQYNSFGKYKYRSCEDIVESVKPLLKQNGLLLTLNDELVLVGDRFYVKATASVWDTADGSRIMVTAYAREEETKKGMDGSQVTGASSSYARKYALNGILAIDDTKDSDSTNIGDHHEQPKEQPKAKNTLPPRDQLIARLKELNINVKAYAAANNITPETTDEGYLKCLRELRNA